MKLEQTIAALRVKTVKNGCSYEEAKSAKDKADKLEEKLRREIDYPVSDDYGLNDVF